MVHGYRYTTPLLLLALASACSDEDSNASSVARPSTAAGGTTSSVAAAGSSSSSSPSASAGRAGASSADRDNGGAVLGNDDATSGGSRGSRGGGRGRDRDQQPDLDAGALDAGDADVLDGGEGGLADAAAPANFSFFATSEGSSANGGNLGGLDGADAFCEQLAARVGAAGRVWRAYLSTSTVNAGDRIGVGPWFNHAGQQVAANLTELHTVGIANGDPQLILDENGATVPSNEHDILTGSQADGTLAAGATCQDWTSSGAVQQNPLNVARVGHADQTNAALISWNAAHDVGGCTQAALIATGGAGRLYCFAAD
jgi:hypothetical protein